MPRLWDEGDQAGRAAARHAASTEWSRCSFRCSASPWRSPYPSLSAYGQQGLCYSEYNLFAGPYDDEAADARGPNAARPAPDEQGDDA